MLEGKYENTGLNFIWDEEEARSKLMNIPFKIDGKPTDIIRPNPNEHEKEMLMALKELLNELQPIENRGENLSQDFETILTQKALAHPLREPIVEHKTIYYEDREDEFEEELEFNGQEDENQQQNDEENLIVLDDEDEFFPSPTKMSKMDNDRTNGNEPQKVVTADDYCMIQPVQKLPLSSGNFVMPSEKDVDKFCDDTFNATVLDIYSDPASVSTQGSADSSDKPWRKVSSNVDRLSVMAIEVLPLTEFAVNALLNINQPSTSNIFLPVPEKDGIYGLFYAIHKDVCNQDKEPDIVGGFVVDVISFYKEHCPEIEIVDSEIMLFHKIVAVIEKYDPDILVGYEIKKFSLGYLADRANHLHIPFISSISRVKVKREINQKDLEEPTGRILFETWKVVRRENPLRSYDFSNVMLEVMKKRFPYFTQKYIEELISMKDPSAAVVVLQHYLKKTSMYTQILCSIDIFKRASQMARVYGIQFNEVLTRGSQYRVESMLLRLALKYKYRAPSVGIEQRNRMASPETIPLTLEPESGIYRDPVIILDFQSLYPSMMIAYNYCFTTCLGKLSNLAQLDQSIENLMTLGALKYSAMPPEKIKELREQNLLHISPVGGIFLKKEVRKGLLSIMVEELLDTRIMVKKFMKLYKNDKKLSQLLDARQLALKLIANVTYGYTAANWSGRMPCEEVADAIVSKGRETLEKAIKMVHEYSDEKYDGARVVYGDTDSLFIVITEKEHLRLEIA
uniref:DNA polymerase n=1 Tax=Acrobeloides nanus TaxID=290746 RepID=A0A914D5P5_9BILA